MVNKISVETITILAIPTIVKYVGAAIFKRNSPKHVSFYLFQ